MTPSDDGKAAVDMLFDEGPPPLDVLDPGDDGDDDGFDGPTYGGSLHPSDLLNPTAPHTLARTSAVLETPVPSPVEMGDEPAGPTRAKRKLSAKAAARQKTRSKARRAAVRAAEKLTRSGAPRVSKSAARRAVHGATAVQTAFKLKRMRVTRAAWLGLRGLVKYAKEAYPLSAMCGPRSKYKMKKICWDGK